MRFLIWALIFTITVGAGFGSLALSAFAQNTGVAPVYIDRAIYKAAQEGLLCSQETIDKLSPSEREARIKVCGLELEIDSELEELNVESEELQASTAEPEVQTSSATSEILASTAEPNSTVVNTEGEEVSILPNPDVDFVEEYVVKFDGNESKDTIFYGGVVPFVALPDSELATEDSFFNEESFSVFFYLKRKF